ncbi:hypothetical protein VE03_03085 [Pseudogymnoascus sp. 23342-1-I1]|nr:hypothetical protein VE03_03085 [Pseudogymnoascus sp. 23342-1-I1]
MSATKHNKLAGKHVLIFGATSGLGFAVAEASLASSATVTITSSSQARIESTIQELTTSFPNSQIRGHTCDLSIDTVEAELDALFEKVRAVDHIIYTAADKIAIVPVQDITRDKIIAAGQMRFVAPMLVAKVGSRYLSPGPESSITMTTGTVCERPFSGWTIAAGYAGGICSMARNLAVDLKPVRVNVVNPGIVDTPFWDKLMTPEQKESMFKTYAAKLPTGRVPNAGDIAEAYIYLMKDVNATGRVVTTDSGALIV